MMSVLMHGLLRWVSASLNQESDAAATPKQAVRRIFPRVLAVYATN
jgi:hypothetical protein